MTRGQAARRAAVQVESLVETTRPFTTAEYRELQQRLDAEQRLANLEYVYHFAQDPLRRYLDEKVI